MWERVRTMIVKEFIQILRNPRMRVVLVLPPVIQLVIFGYAATTDIRQVATGVADFDRTQATRELVRRFESSGYFRVVRTMTSAADVRAMLDDGRVKIALQFDPGFARDLQRGQPAVVQLLVDGTDSNTATVAASYAARIVEEYSQAWAPPARVALRPVGSVDLRLRAWYNPDLRSRNYFVPAVIAMVIMLTALQLTSMAIVREREIGTMEQLLVSPLRPAELILGKTLPFGFIALADVALITAIAVFWFDVPIRGSLALLFGATVVYLLSALGIGLFISTVSRTQQQALMSTFLFFQPTILLSGFVFPIQNMPVAIQYLTYANPLRYFLVVIRGLFLKGNGLAVLWPDLLALLAIGGAVFMVSVLRFRRMLE
jgi:ABC-2 type transport system permease protein